MADIIEAVEGLEEAQFSLRYESLSGQKKYALQIERAAEGTLNEGQSLKQSEIPEEDVMNVFRIALAIDFRANRNTQTI